MINKHIDCIAISEHLGGPQDIDSLFSIAEIRSDVPYYAVLELIEKEIELNQGLYHNVAGSEIRFTGRKKMQDH